jgi:hypothetical protein
MPYQSSPEYHGVIIALQQQQGRNDLTLLSFDHDTLNLTRMA